MNMQGEPYTTATAIRSRGTDLASREAFDAAVREYLRMVYAAARRQVGADRAEDLTQSVFVLLWQRWHRIPRAQLAGWLIKTTRFVALQDNRSEFRRHRRELV